MNLHRLILLLREHDLSEATENLREVLDDMVQSLEAHLALTPDTEYKEVKRLVRDIGRLRELYELTEENN